MLTQDYVGFIDNVHASGPSADATIEQLMHLIVNWDSLQTRQSSEGTWSPEEPPEACGRLPTCDNTTARTSERVAG
jgi:hypothetical protein